MERVKIIITNTSSSGNVMALYKLIKEIKNVSIVEAMNLVSTLPYTLLDDCSDSDLINRVKRTLGDATVKYEIQNLVSSSSSSLSTPSSSSGSVSITIKGLDIGGDEQAAIKIIKQVRNCSLVQAMSLIGSCPFVLVENISQNDANRIINDLKGAKVLYEIKGGEVPASTPSGSSTVKPTINTNTGSVKKIVVLGLERGGDEQTAIKLVRQIKGCSLVQAMSLLGSCPFTLVENPSNANDIIAQLKNANIKYEVDGAGSSSTVTPPKPTSTQTSSTFSSGSTNKPHEEGTGHDEMPASTMSSAEAKLAEMIGLESVKREIEKIKAYVYKNEGEKINCHMFFVGNPGTGKTVVARLIGEILFNAGALPENKFIEVSANDLLSPYIGGTPTQTMNKVKEAMGGVLFIDEAYTLNPKENQHGKECVDTLIKAMEDHRGEFCCIFAGYPEDMDMLITSNPGFESRIKFKIHFEDYTRDEINQIVSGFLKSKKYTIDEDAMNQLLNIVDMNRFSKNFGNARTGRTIAESLMMIQAVRTSNNKADRNITMEDVKIYADDNNITLISEETAGASEARAELDKLVGLDSVKETLDDLISFFAMNAGKKTDFHMAFLGNPGTGKTVVARIVGKLLNQEGLLPSTKFIEASSQDLIAPYVGQTAPKTRALCEKAMGGVLFIDEAYTLAGGGNVTAGGSDFGAEAVAELLKQMEDHRGDFCVILAGYTKEMQGLFNLNPGLESRVKFQIEFPNYNEEELFKMAHMYLKKDDYQMDDDLIKVVVSLVYANRHYKNYANARTLREAFSKIEIKQAGRMRGESVKNRVLLLEDIKKVFDPDLVDKAVALTSGEGVEEVEEVVPMVNLEELQELYKNVKDSPFASIQKDLEEAIVAIKTDTGESSGFIFTPDGYVGTCAHCVRGAKEIQVRYRIVHRGKNIDNFYPATIIDIDDESDTAIIKMKSNENFLFATLSSEETEDLEPLSKVYLLGYPFGFSRFDQMSVNEGKIASYQRKMFNQPDQINLDISAKSGNSGSAVLDANTGKVIGVLCGSSTSRSGMLIEEINYCRPISYIWNLIRRKQ